MIIGILIAFAFGIAIGALLQSHLSHMALLKRRAQELEDHRNDE